MTDNFKRMPTNGISQNNYEQSVAINDSHIADDSPSTSQVHDIPKDSIPNHANFKKF